MKRIPIDDAVRMGCANGHTDGRVVFCSACGHSRFDDPARTTEKLIERSSLGTPEAKAARDSVPDEVARRIVERAKELGATGEQR